MRKSLLTLVALGLAAASQIGCRACGGSHLDYASPVANCSCAACDCAGRAGTVLTRAGETVISTHAGPPMPADGMILHEGGVVIEEAPSAIPAAPPLP